MRTPLLCLALCALSSTALPQAEALLRKPPTLGAPQEEAKLTVVLYDVRDLLDQLTPRSIELAEDLKGDFAEALARKHEARKAESLEELGRGLQLFVEPAWNKEKNRCESITGGVLAFGATAEQHTWIAKTLDALRARPLPTVLIETTYLEIPRNGLRELGFESGPYGSLTPEQETKLREAMHAAKSGKGWDVLMTPEIVTRPFSPCSIETSNQVAYVKDWTVHLIEPEQQLIADPVVDTVSEGLKLDLTCAALAEGRFGVDLRFERSELERPIRTKKVRIATDPASDVSISLPEVTTVRLETKFTLQPGRLTAFTTPTSQEDRDFVILLSVAPVTPAETPAAPAAPGSDPRR
ncbi:MAG: hypothetical protein H6828_05410 [Planctomycetes bacterium]|nr:hypothetical protein [Planctomycetota bacterium]